MAFQLNWKGGEVAEQVLTKTEAIMSDIGLHSEGEAKKILQPNAGVITGTLRRSIHSASPDYNWGDDHVKPNKQTPERGGKAAKAKKRFGRIVISVGSGMRYALAIEDKYGYLTDGVELTRAVVPKIISKHKVG